MRTSSLFFFFFVAISTQLTAQLSGRVLDAVDHTPLPGAHVFLDGTQQGTTTDDNGHFELPMGAFSNGTLVVSYLGYQSQAISLEQKHDTLTVNLQPVAQSLATAEVKAASSKKRKRWLRQFKKDFLGSSVDASQCEILNPQVIRFEEKNGNLLATAGQPIEVENNATGYHLYFLLEDFRSNGVTVSYAGKAFFRELRTDDDRTLKKWEKNRAEIWKHSKRRFLLALIHNRLEAEGYSVVAGRINAEKEFEALKRIVGARDLVEERSGGYFSVKLPGVVRVSDGATRPGSEDYQRLINLGKDHETSPLAHATGKEEARYSYLVATRPQVAITRFGTIMQPELVKEFGYFAAQRVAEMLPLEYGSNVDEVTQVPVINGFQLTNLRIPLDEIKSGGPPRDGIPAIDQPRFATAGQATFLNDDDWVLGVVFNFTAKAYPIKILNWHEIVNDRFAGEPVVVTWCPLCGSGMAFKGRDSGGTLRQFGVSGLLYNSDVLMYDRQSESLWSQVMGQAVAGPASGRTLTLLPTELCTWESWKARHPDTRVLTTDTGFGRDYSSDPYAGYQQRSQLMFPVAEVNEALPPKSRVLGVEIAGQYKAYPLEVLKKQKLTTDRLAGKQVRIQWDDKARAPHLTVDGEPWPAVNLFWFAWYAFHPDTLLYQP